jgi:integrase
MAVKTVKLNKAGFKDLKELQKKCSKFPVRVRFDDHPFAIAMIWKNKISLGHTFNHENVRKTEMWADINSISPSDYKAQVTVIYLNIVNGNSCIINEPTIQEFYDDIVAPYSEVKHKDSKGFKKHMEPLLKNYGNKTLTEFQKQWISLLLIELVETVCTPTQARYLARWTKFFNLAIDYDFLDRNPCKGIPKPRENPPRDRVLSLPEINALIEAAMTDIGPVHAGCILLCLFTGLRQGNIRELKISWFNASYTTLSIPDSKSGKPIYTALNSVAQSIVKRGLAYSDGVYLFPANNSTALEPKYMSKPTKCMARLVAHVQTRTGITDHFHCHDLRSTHSSLMAQLTGDTRLCQQTLGHADIKTTLRYTYHSNPELLAASELTATALLGGRFLEDFNSTIEKKL